MITVLTTSSIVNNLSGLHTPWRKDGAIITLTTDPLPESPTTPAWYHPTRGDIFVNLNVVFGNAESSVLNAVLFDLTHDNKESNDRGIVWGLIAHEAAHSQWTTWEPSDLGEKINPLVVQVATLFEEIRIEKRAADRGKGSAIGMLRCSFGWLLKQLKDELSTDPMSLGHTWALAYGRHIARVASLTEVEPVDSTVRIALGDDTVDTMREILEEAVDWDTAPQKLAKLAQEWIDLLLPEGEPEDLPSLSLILHGEEGGDSDDSEAPATSGVGAGDPELADVLRDDLDDVVHSLEEHALPPQPETPLSDPQEMAAKVFRKNALTSRDTNRRSSGYYANWVDRDPTDGLRRHAARFSRTLERLALPSITLTRTPAELPPGRLRGREMVRQGAERSRGMMSTATPWERSKRKRTHIKPVIVGVATDTSGSMSWAQNFVADFAWIMATAGHRIGARAAAVTFGSQAEMVTRPGEIPNKVRVRQANGAEENFDNAVAALDGVLHLSVPNNAAKILFVVSDCHFVKTGESRRAQKWIQRITRGGTLVVWLGGDTEKLNYVSMLAAPGMFVSTPPSATDPDELLAAMEAIVTKAAGALA